jgi:hypothetical protein
VRQPAPTLPWAYVLDQSSLGRPLSRAVWKIRTGVGTREISRKLRKKRER